MEKYVDIKETIHKGEDELNRDKMDSFKLHPLHVCVTTILCYYHPAKLLEVMTALLPEFDVPPLFGKKHAKNKYYNVCMSILRKNNVAPQNIFNTTWLL